MANVGKNSSIFADDADTYLIGATLEAKDESHHVAQRGCVAATALATCKWLRAVPSVDGAPSAACCPRTMSTAQATAHAVAEKLEVEMKEFRALRDGTTPTSLHRLGLRRLRESEREFPPISPDLISEATKHAAARSTLVTQLQENEMVKKVTTRLLHRPQLASPHHTLHLWWLWALRERILDPR